MSNTYWANNPAPRCPNYTAIIICSPPLEACLLQKRSLFNFSALVRGVGKIIAAVERVCRGGYTSSTPVISSSFSANLTAIYRNENTRRSRSVIVFHLHIRPWAVKVVTVSGAEWSTSIGSRCFSINVQARRLEYNGSALALHSWCYKW